MTVTENETKAPRLLYRDMRSRAEELADEKLKERVLAGIEWLNETYGPDWVDHVDPSVLTMADGCRCVLGQLYEENSEGESGYWYALRRIALVHEGKVDEWAADHGFTIPVASASDSRRSSKAGCTFSTRQVCHPGREKARDRSRAFSIFTKGDCVMQNVREIKKTLVDPYGDGLIEATYWAFPTTHYKDRSTYYMVTLEDDVQLNVGFYRWTGNAECAIMYEYLDHAALQMPWSMFERAARLVLDGSLSSAMRSKGSLHREGDWIVFRAGCGERYRIRPSVLRGLLA